MFQRAELQYLYNMSSATSSDDASCGAVNSACAKAWAMLTGEVDDHSSSTLLGVTGGGGIWNGMAFVSSHWKESRTDSATFYCPTQAAKDALPDSTCGAAGGSNNPTGRVLSRYAHPTD